jgi:hypothetical protein
MLESFDMSSQVRSLTPTILLLTSIILSAHLTVAEGEQKTSLQIEARNAHAMVYDIARERVILFGGADESKVCGDTWEWDGQMWTLVNQSGPGPRTFPAMAYDSVRKKVVLFGGNRVLFGRSPAEIKFLDDTWEWDGKKWTRIEAAGPSPRAEAAMAFDGRRQRVVLFGGHNRTGESGSRLGDTWEWDGTRWIEIKVSGPSPRNSPALAYDNLRGKIVLCGGSTLGAVSGETWEWDGKEWVEKREALTQGRFNSVMVYDGARLIRFGGRYEGKAFGDTWAFDGEGWKQLTAIGPAARNHTAMVYDSKRRKIVLFGGHDFGTYEWANVFADTWEWDGGKWLQRAGGETRRRINNGH